MKLNVITLSVLALLIIGIQSCKQVEKSNSDEEVIKEPVKLKSTIINDYVINYLDIGKGDPVVFVHGGVGDYRTWEAQTEEFAKQNRVIAYSRRYAYPNMQEADSLNDYSVITHSKDLTQFLKTLDLGPVHLVGHSYGAFTSLMTSLEAPELVKTLTLGEPPVMSFLQYVEDGEELGTGFVEHVAIPAVEAFQRGEDEKAVEIFIGAVLNDSLYYTNAPQNQKDIMMANAFGLKGELLTPNPFPPLVCDDVKRLNTPVLLIKGERSPRFLTTLTDVLDSCLENSELKVLANASHGLEYENPEAFNKMVLDFIALH